MDVFEWRHEKFIFDEEFIQDCHEDSNKKYLLEADVEYSKDLHELHSGLSFLPKRIKTDKFKELVCSLYNEENYVVHIIALKQGLDHGLILEQVQKINEFNQEAWSKAYTYINTELTANIKNDFENNLFKFMNNSVLRKTMTNIRKHSDFKLITV